MNDWWDHKRPPWTRWCWRHRTRKVPDYEWYVYVCPVCKGWDT